MGHIENKSNDTLTSPRASGDANYMEQGVIRHMASKHLFMFDIISLISADQLEKYQLGFIFSNTW